MALRPRKIALGSGDSLAPRIRELTAPGIQEFVKARIPEASLREFLAAKMDEDSIESVRKIMELRGEMYSVPGETTSQLTANNALRKRLFDMSIALIYEEVFTPEQVVSTAKLLGLSASVQLFEKMVMLEYGAFILERSITETTKAFEAYYIADNIAEVYHSDGTRKSYKDLANLESELADILADTGSIQATLSTDTAAVTLTSGTTAFMLAGQTLSKTSGTGEFASGATISSITGPTTFTMSSNHSTAGAITFQTSVISTILSLIPDFGSKAAVRINGRQAQAEGQYLPRYKFLLNYNTSGALYDRDMLRKYWAIQPYGSGTYGYYVRDGERIYFSGLTGYSYYGMLNSSYDQSGNPTAAGYKTAHDFLLGFWRKVDERTIHY